VGSIPTIVSTLPRWAWIKSAAAGSSGLQGFLKSLGLKGLGKKLSKKLIHSTLLRFPGGNSHDPIACVYCPEMCRFSCPTAVVSANDAVTPCNKMGLLHKEARWPGQAAGGQPLWPLYDCTGCGRCTEYCVYEMPVALTLFEARKKHPWERAERAAKELTDAEDPVGDLADELGDEKNSIRRFERFTSARGELVQVPEPKSVYFLLKKGISADLTWEDALEDSRLAGWAQRLAGRTWLLHESVWLSRRLEGAAEIAVWVEKARAAGIELQLPFEHGMDCTDCGGEGAYSRLFPEQARQMAVDLWARDQHRAQGVLCFSARCAEHLRKCMPAGVPVVSLSEENHL
jgi:ferredoxin